MKIDDLNIRHKAYRMNSTIDIHYLKSSIRNLGKNSRSIDHKQSRYSVKEKSKIIQSNLNKLLTNKVSQYHIRHIGLQTIYREESTQTDPFSPVYTISNGEHPEVFTLSDFTYGKGLPATSVEISFIERLRARREWEQDRTIDITRTKIVIERELREWELREKEIKMLEEIQHKLFINNLQNYIQTDENLTKSLIDLEIYRKTKQLKYQDQRLEIKASRDIRRIQRIYRLRHAQINAMTNFRYLGVIGLESYGNNGCVKLLKPPWHIRSDDIITNFKNKFSKISILCPSFDYLIDQRMKQSQIDIFQLEKILPKTALNYSLNHSLENTNNRKQRHRIRNLERASQLIKQDSSIEKKPLRFIEKIETINHIQPLSLTPIQIEKSDQRHQIIIQLQNYLRCIIVQSKITNIYEIRQDLLNELRQELNSNQFSSTEHFNKQLKSISTEISDYFIDETIADMLDFLSKELLRLQCEQTIQLFIILADRKRRQHEAMETGSRTHEIENQILQQIFSLDSNCDIENYLEDLILHSIYKTADEQAKFQIQEITQILIKQTDLVCSNESDLINLVADLVHNFLIPTVSSILKTHHNQ